MINLAFMKIVPFQIPKTGDESIRVQADTVPYLYNHLHQHPEIQVTLISKSSGTLIAGDYVGRFEAGDVFVIGSNQPHVFRNDAVYFKKKLLAASVTVFFDEHTFGKRFWQQAELSAFVPFFDQSQGGYKIKGEKQVQIAQILGAFVTASGIDRIRLFIELISLLSTKTDLTPLSQTITKRSIKSFDGDRLNRIIAYTFRENHRSIRLEEIAAEANMTVEAFCKYFKTRTGKSYINFLNEIRISNACKLLLLGDKAVTAICYESGFANLSNFNRVFKKITGKTPKAFRSANN